MGNFHKRDDQNKNGKLSTSEMIKTKMGNFTQARLSKTKCEITFHKRDDQN
jgi:hypothetical protein